MSARTHLPGRHRARAPGGRSADMVRAPRVRGEAGATSCALPPLRSFPSAAPGRGVGRTQGGGAGLGQGGVGRGLGKGGAASPAPSARARPTLLSSPGPPRGSWRGPEAGPRGTSATLPPPPLSSPHSVRPRPVRDHNGSSAPGRTCFSAREKPLTLSGDTPPRRAPRQGLGLKPGAKRRQLGHAACGGAWPTPRRPGGARGEGGDGQKRRTSQAWPRNPHSHPPKVEKAGGGARLGGL